jgi:hypothetical protein
LEKEKTMTQTHTPGPWQVRHDEYARGRLHIGPKTDDTVCTLSGRQSTRNAADANARLIACAPELLEALLAIFPDKGPTLIVNERTIRKATAAIAKARGE